MGEEITCESLIRAKREGINHYPHKCGLPAARYKVSGHSYAVYASLCHEHAAKARADDGLTLVPVEKAVESVQNA